MQQTSGSGSRHSSQHNKNTHTFNGPLSGTTQVSWYQKGKTNLDFTEARDSEWQWHQLGHMQVCTLLQTGNHASTSPLKFFTGRMLFLLPTNSVKALKAQQKVYKINSFYGEMFTFLFLVVM